ncbi:MAG TPA: ferritin-like domain-containing protein [Planctomycetota bacterium]|nr:ferritin-like domain-containing protein [Planctomycetota bacterium]
MDPRTGPAGARRRLVHFLHLAHGGEFGAAIAYQSHARSVRRAAERNRILEIRAEEIDHRQRVGRILARLGERPDPEIERTMARMGRAIAAFCRVGGWFLPMYGAGRLERRNIVEYEDAARAAALSGHPEFVDDLLDMAEVEWEHERFFRLTAATHPWWRWFPKWSPPPPREEIRRSFAEFRHQALRVPSEADLAAAMGCM